MPKVPSREFPRSGSKAIERKREERRVKVSVNNGQFINA